MPDQNYNVITETPSCEIPPDESKSGERNTFIKKILCIFFILAVIALSVVVFLNRGKIQYIGNYGYLGVFVLCFICNATVFAPAPGLIVVITAATFLNPLIVCIVGALGTTFGELTGYFSGKAGKNIGKIKNERLGQMVQKYGSPVVFCFALLPLPLFDIIGVASGFLGIKWYKFIISCYFGKFIKMLLYAYGFTYLQKVLSDLHIFL
jgi:membrane protein YqaA with SNARE-associated domain